MKKWLFVAAAWFLLSALTPYTLQNFQLTVSSAGPGPSVSINGSMTAGQVLTAGSTMTIVAAGGPGNQNDELYVCDHADGCGPTNSLDYSYLNCSKTVPASPPYPTGTPPAGCSMIVPTPNGSYYVAFKQNIAPVTTLASLDFSVGAPPPGPTIAVNGSSTGATVTGTTMSVAVTGGGGTGYAANAWMGVCQAGVTLSAATCDTPYPANWVYVNSCTQTAGGSVVAANTCPTVTAPTTVGNYVEAFFRSGTNYTALATAPFNVPSSGPTIAVNGTTSGVTVTSSANLTVAVSNGPAAVDDWMGICNAGQTPSAAQCDGAGYDWAWVDNCTKTGTLPPAGVAANTCTLKAPSAAGSYTATFFHTQAYTSPIATAPLTVVSGPVSITAAAVAPNTFSVPSGGTASFTGTLTATCSVSPCPGPATFSLSAPGQPTITANGSSSNVLVSPSASLAIAVANGPGNPRDYIQICTGSPCSAANHIVGAWVYINGCSQTPPSVGVTSASCTMTAPTASGQYYIDFLGNDTYNFLAEVPVTVTAGAGGGPCTTSVSTSSPVPCPVGAGPAAPSGQHWNLVYEDVFTQDSGARPEWVLQCLDSGGWHPGPACYPGGFVYDSTNGLSLSSTRVAQSVTQQRSQVVMNTAFKFGYWEWSGKNAINVNGEGQGIHSDFYLMRAASTPYAEVDVNEHPNGPGNRAWTNYFVAPGAGLPNNFTGSYPSTSVGNLDDTFHIYGVWWRNDSLSVNGSVQPFLDGTAQIQALGIDGGNNTWAGGAVWTIIEDGCTDDTWGGGAVCPGPVPLLDPDPVMAKYLRIWQLAPN